MSKKQASKKSGETTYPRPLWVPQTILSEEELCPDCFKVVGDKSRYKVVCLLGKARDGLTVGQITEHLGLTQPTVTHHLQVLREVHAVTCTPSGKERIYALNRNAHCFEECHIPYK